jgi:hypothetical protein
MGISNNYPLAVIPGGVGEIPKSQLTKRYITPKRPLPPSFPKNLRSEKARFTSTVNLHQMRHRLLFTAKFLSNDGGRKEVSETLYNLLYRVLPHAQ